jgi:hypothetical protein
MVPATVHREKAPRNEGTKLKPAIRKKTATTKKAVVSAKKKTSKNTVAKAVSTTAGKREDRADQAPQKSVAPPPRVDSESRASVQNDDATDPSTMASRPATRTGKPVAKAAGSNTVTKKTLRTRPGASELKDQDKEPSMDEVSPETAAKPNSVQKKQGGRRGIRLKSLKDTGDDGLN